ncbi:RYamide receptor-like [Patiria miniata]|uniref:G-protein coupled receptors family 1 profile domain-containing protein n=1 Tax=Patiria miniata TaxID=46514 RepID=A0A914A8A6_PATMI|nr:RYamide receptor-like [Patiria miniata]
MANLTEITNFSSANATEEPDYYDVEYYKEPVWVQAIFISLYGTVSVLGICGNGIVCYIVLGHQRMRTVTNYFIVNLAIGDLLMAAMCVNFTVYATLYTRWPFGEVMCKLVSFCQTISVSVSIYTLVAIGVDRYFAIIHPLRPRMGSKETLFVIGVIWVISVALALPAVLFTTVETAGDATFCTDGSWEDSLVYSLICMVLQYFLPLTVLTAAYIRIGKRIWGRRTPGEVEAERDKKMSESKARLVKMFATIVLLFALCYLPIQIYTIVQDSNQNVLFFYYIKIIYLCALLAAMSNCVYNPFIYCWMNIKFRNGFRSVFRFLPCVTYQGDWNGFKGLRRANTGQTQMETLSTGSRMDRGRWWTHDQAKPNKNGRASNSDGETRTSFM